MSEDYSFNLRWYATYGGLVSVFAWVPVFGLYFSQYLDLRGLLILEAIYFVSVVVWEVPSGYLADRLGRKKTILLASGAMFLAYLAFFFASRVRSAHELLVLGQVLFALGVASLSGADTALHYESLKLTGRQAEYDEREAHVQRVSLGAMSVSALAGGLLGSINLAYAYALSAAAASGAFLLASRFREPDREYDAPQLVAAIRDSFSNLKVSKLWWFFSFSVLMYVLGHVPYEFFQPYLTLLELPTATATVSGVATAGTMGLASYVSGRSIWIRDRIGLFSTLFVSAVFILLTIGLLGTILHPAMLLVIVCRNVPFSLSTAPLKAKIVPLIDPSHRATFLSLQSVCGRLVFAVMLFGVAQLNPTTGLNYQGVSSALVSFLGFGVVSVALLFLIRPKSS